MVKYGILIEGGKMIIKLYEKELKKEKIFRSFLEEEVISEKSKSSGYVDLLHKDLKKSNQKIQWLQKKIYS